jgi:hypothetical protein
MLPATSDDFLPHAGGSAKPREMRVRTHRLKSRGLAWKLAIPAVCLAAASQLAFAGTASATHAGASARSASSNAFNLEDCNATLMIRLCTDPVGKAYNGHPGRFRDPITGAYVGHDEPSVKFISSQAGSGNTFTYGMRLSRDPARAPTASGSVTKYAELSVAPWFGLPMCDPNSYPQNPCTPLSDSNTGLGATTDAGSAFMELQFYPPGFTPFVDSVSCSRTQWCAALTIDSLACTFNFATCNNNCIEPVNFAFLQTNGVPAGPPAPQNTTLATLSGNGRTLKMNPGDRLKVSVSDVPSSGSPDTGGLRAAVTDLTTGRTGFIVASAANGFQNTSIADCSGTPFSFHAEYNTAQQQNQVPWAALEGGVLMEQEIGHGESCSSVSNQLGFSFTGADGSSYSDPNVFQTCNGGQEGAGATGEGPCDPTTFICQNATTQGVNGPVACPTNNAASGALCEFSDANCFPRGNRPVVIDGTPARENAPVAYCNQEAFQNGDLDFDGTGYHADWPDGSRNFPTSISYTGPLSRGQAYPDIQFETNTAASEALCDVATGAGCTAPPQGAAFYPFWSLTNQSASGTCVWNFGNEIANVTTNDFGKDAQYGTPDVARFGGTLTSPVTANPSLAANCAA